MASFIAIEKLSAQIQQCHNDPESERRKAQMFKFLNFTYVINHILYGNF